MTDSGLDIELNVSAAHVAELLARQARRRGDDVAVAELQHPRRRGRDAWGALSFHQLDEQATRVAVGLGRWGVQPGTRLCLLVPPGLEFVSLVFGLVRAGVVIVLIDPGMGRQNLLRCLAEARPQGIIGPPIVQAARRVFRRRLPDAKWNVVTAGRFVRGWPGCASPHQLCQLAPSSTDECHSQLPTIQSTDPAAIIFTTGSTGPPKGVEYLHSQFVHQAMLLRDGFNIEPGGADVSGFPLFALFNAGLGTTTVFPRMNATKPAEVDPVEIIRAVSDWSADQSFGSPALWNTVGRYCEQRSITLPTLRRVFSAGAPVPTHVIERLQRMAPNGEVYTPYGATEALPVSAISATDIVNETAALSRQGAGTCTGRRFPSIQWRVIRITDQPLSTFDEVQEIACGEIGELIVSGPVVTRRYVTRTAANALHKIQDDQTVWHRMGDVGYLDEQDRFWFCGRKSHRVQTVQRTMFTIPCEAIVNNHPAVYRSALVGIGPARSQTPVIVAEPWPERWPRGTAAQERLINEIHTIVQQHDLTRGVQHVLLHRKLPTDIRHNSKIFREQLAVWATKRIVAQAPSP